MLWEQFDCSQSDWWLFHGNWQHERHVINIEMRISWNLPFQNCVFAWICKRLFQMFLLHEKLKSKNCLFELQIWASSYFPSIQQLSVVSHRNVIIFSRENHYYIFWLFLYILSLYFVFAKVKHLRREAEYNPKASPVRALVAEDFLWMWMKF